MKTRRALALFTALLVFSSGCARNASDENPIVSSAPGAPFIGSVETFQVASASDQVTLVIRGQFPDNCTALGEIATEQAGQEFQVSVSTVPLEGASCSSVAVNFERVVTLDVTGLSPGTYQVNVEGLVSNFKLDKSRQVAGDLVPSVEENSEEAAPTSEVEVSATPMPAVEGEEESLETENEPTPTPQSTEATQTTTEACEDKAAFYGDVTVPDGTAFQQGEKFVKTWKIRNEGSCTWGPQYSLVFSGGDIMGAPLSNPIPEVVPGEIAEISLELTTPSRGGPHQSDWEFQNAFGERFGTGSGGLFPIWVKIVASYILPGEGSTGSGSAGTSAGAACGAQQNTAYEAEVAALVNDARAAQGLNPLAVQDQLAAAAAVHSQDMACQDFVDHVGSDGEKWYARVATQGYANSASARENIYVGNPDFGGTPQGAFDWWMNSKVHRENILNPNVNDIGVGYFFNSSSTYGGYYTLVVARP